MANRQIVLGKWRRETDASGWKADAYPTFEDGKTLEMSYFSAPPG
jgi:hypothetical protein